MTIVDVTSTTISLNWSEVPAIDRNGIITQYEVEYNQTTFNVSTAQTVTVNSTMILFTDENMAQSVIVDIMTALLSGLHEYVEYSIRVRAYTSVGPGPYSDAINVTTDEDGELLSLCKADISICPFISSSLWFPIEYHCH